MNLKRRVSREYNLFWKNQTGKKEDSREDKYSSTFTMAIIYGSSENGVYRWTRDIASMWITKRKRRENNIAIRRGSHCMNGKCHQRKQIP